MGALRLAAVHVHERAAFGCGKVTADRHGGAPEGLRRRHRVGLVRPRRARRDAQWRRINLHARRVRALHRPCKRQQLGHVPVHLQGKRQRQPTLLASQPRKRPHVHSAVPAPCRRRQARWRQAWPWLRPAPASPAQPRRWPPAAGTASTTSFARETGNARAWGKMLADKGSAQTPTAGCRVEKCRARARLHRAAMFVLPKHGAASY